jgi:predicted lipoprotein with Yx(FWY)xxD motif
VKRATIFPALAVALLVGAACAEEPDAELDGAPEAGAEPYEAPAPGVAAAAALATDSLHGGAQYLTDARGRALYMLELTSGGPTGCDEACREYWPPFAVAGDAPEPGGATVNEDLVGTRPLPDGTQQVTYAGHDLYYFHLDENPGDTKGQNRTDGWGVWYLVGPEGTRVQPSPSDPPS